MARRGNNSDSAIAAGLIQVAGLLCLGVVVLFGGMKALSAFVIPLIVALAILFVALILGGLLLVKMIQWFNASMGGETAPSTETLEVATPRMDRAESTAELVQQIRSIDWFQFEQLVCLVCQKRGYTVRRRGGANADGGIDLEVEKDGKKVAIQCKHWKTWNVGVKAVREFLGALTDAGISRGKFITLGGYTGDAKVLADKHHIVMVNETDFARMLEATDARNDPAILEILNDTRKLCPKCEAEMVLRTSKRGPGAGKQFWGCSRYPACRFTMPL